MSDPLDSATTDMTVIVVPCYNEARRLDVRAFSAFVSNTPHVRFLFVNDGSNDGTGRLLEQFSQTNPRALIVTALSRNAGKAEAVRQGMLRALELGPAFAGYWDADLSTPLDAILEFRRHLQTHASCEIVLGARVKLLGRRIDRRIVRHYAGRVFATAASMALKLPVYDTQCGAKLFRVTPLLPDLFATPFRSRWVFDVEILARLLNLGRASGFDAATAIYELPLMEWRDVSGSKVKALDFPRALVEMIGIYWTYLRPGAPTRGERGP
jgi:glycosyltransferase involved in cell wall biosynthesis